MKKIFMFFFVACVILGVTRLLAQPDHEPGFNPPRLPEELKLTKEQKQDIKQLRVKLQKELVPLKSKLQLARLDLQTETDADKPNTTRINSLVDEMARTRAEITKLSIGHRLAVAQLLTPEQRDVWRESKGKMHRDGRRERRPGWRHFRGSRQPME